MIVTPTPRTSLNKEKANKDTRIVRQIAYLPKKPNNFGSTSPWLLEATWPLVTPCSIEAHELYHVEYPSSPAFHESHAAGLVPSQPLVQVTQACSKNRGFAPSADFRVCSADFWAFSADVRGIWLAKFAACCHKSID